MDFKNKIIADMRRQYGPHCYKPNHPDALESFLMVGAFFNGEGLKRIDSLYFETVLKMLKMHRVPVSKKFNVSAININKPFGGEDFLKTDRYKADMVVVCFISDQPTPPDFIRDLEFSTKIGDIDALLASPDHLKPNAWPDAALRANAKMVTTVFSLYGPRISEINSAHFNADNKFMNFGPPYEAQLPERDGKTYVFNFQMLKNAAWQPSELKLEI